MRTLIATFSLVTVAGVATFLVLRFLGLPQGLALGLASLFLVVLPQVHDALEERFEKAEKRHEVTKAAEQGAEEIAAQQPRRAPFTLPWYLLLAYGSVMLFVATEASVLLLSFNWGWAISSPAQSRTSDADVMVLSTVIVLLTPLTQVVVAFLVGNWIGIRCKERGGLLLAGAVVIAVIPVLIGLVLFDPQGSFFARLANVENDPTFSDPAMRVAVMVITAAVLSIPGVALSIILGIIGVRRGQRARPARYLGHLLSGLASKTRQAIVQMAYEEAQRLSESEDKTGEEGPAT